MKFSKVSTVFWLISGVAVIVGLFSQLGYAQATVKETGAAPPTITTPTVKLWLSVTDKQNHYLDDLKKEEITVLENGKPEEILVCKLIPEAPLTVAILVDVSGSQRYVLAPLKIAGAEFINLVLRPGKDAAALIKFEGEPTVVQTLTLDKGLLQAALSQLTYVSYVPASAKPPINSRQGGTSLFDAVVAACTNLLAKETGRKIIILLSDGVDTTSRLKVQDAINKAVRTEVMIYAFGIGDMDTAGTFGGSGVAEGLLKKLTEATGGRTFLPRKQKELAQALASLTEELRNQYFVEYVPNTQNNKPHSFEIRLSGREKVKVRAAKYIIPTISSSASK